MCVMDDAGHLVNFKFRTSMDLKILIHLIDFPRLELY